MDLPMVESDVPVFEYPHDVLRFHLTGFGENLAENRPTIGISRRPTACSWPQELRWANT